MLNRLKRRDLRLFVIFCGGLVGYPYYAMVVMGLLTHGVVVGILVNGWRLQPAVAGVAIVPGRKSFARSRFALASAGASSPRASTPPQAADVPAE